MIWPATSAAKIGAGILAVAMVAGAGTAVVNGNRDKDTPTETTGDTKPHHTHNYISSVVKPTCSMQGVAIYLCMCGDSYVEFTEPTGHSWGRWEVTKTADSGSRGTASQDLQSMQSIGISVVAQGGYLGVCDPNGKVTQLFDGVFLFDINSFFKII